MPRLYILLLIFLLAGCACDRKKTSSNQTDPYDTLYKARYAERFELLGRGDTIILRVHNPWQGAENKSFEYRITKPLRRMVCMSSSHVAFLDAVGKADGKVAGVSGARFLTNERIRSQAADVGFDRNINYELLVGLQPDMIFAYEVGGENSAMVQKFGQLRLPVMYVADYLENSPLGRAEWVVALGALTGQLDRATTLFDSIETSYNHTRQQVDSLLATGAKRPRVMLNAPYRDVWYAPGDRSYMVRLIRDAGADYAAAGEDSDTSRPVALEVAYNLMRGSDFWLNPGSVQTLNGLQVQNPRFAKLPVVTKGKVYNNNLRATEEGGSDFWESGTVRPDVVLLDLVGIFHPELVPTHKLYYHHKLK